MNEKPVPGYSPVYCALYPELAKLAREHGYALAVHGSLRRDFDLIAVPWAEAPSDPDVLVEAFTTTFALHRTSDSPVKKAHGRIAYTISIGFGEAALDLSFMPRAEPVIKDSLKTARVVLPEVHVPRASHEVSTVFPAPGSLRVDITSRAGGTIRFGVGGYVGSGGGFVIDEVSLVRPPGPRLGQPDEIEGGE